MSLCLPTPVTHIAVFAIDGATPQNRIPFEAYSPAKAFVAPSAPAFDALVKFAVSDTVSLELPGGMYAFALRHPLTRRMKVLVWVGWRSYYVSRKKGFRVSLC